MGRADAENAELHNAELAAPMPSEIYELAERWTWIAVAFGFPPPMTPVWALILAREVVRLRCELAFAEHGRSSLEAKLAHEERMRAVVEGELADMNAIATSMAAPDAGDNPSALVEAIELIKSIARRGLLTNREKERLRVLERAVPS